MDLLDKLLTLNPDNRITAADALLHPFFKEGIPLKEKLPLVSADKFHYAGAKSALDKLRKSRPLYVHVRAAVPDSEALIPTNDVTILPVSSAAPILSASMAITDNLVQSSSNIGVSRGGLKRPRPGTGEEPTIDSDNLLSISNMSTSTLVADNKITLDSSKRVDRGNLVTGKPVTSLLAFVRPVKLLTKKDEKSKIEIIKSKSPNSEDSIE